MVGVTGDCHTEIRRVKSDEMHVTDRGKTWHTIKNDSRFGL